MNKNSAAVPVPQPGGKLYYEVQDRINFLHELYPARCEVHSTLDPTFALQNNPFEVVAFTAEIIIYTTEGEKRSFDGWAYEKKDNPNSPVNKEAHIENCETSAIGRALEHAGFVGDAENPSYEAMLKTGAFTENASTKPMSQEEIDKRRQTGEFKGKNRGDANKPASDKQKQYMTSLGLKFDDSISSAAASDLIEQKKEKKGASTDSTPPKAATTPPPTTAAKEQPNYKDDPETKDMRLQVVSFVIDHSEFITSAFGSTDTFWQAVMTRYNSKTSAVMPAVSWKNLRDGCLAAANHKNEETGILAFQTFLEYTPPNPKGAS